MAEQKKDIYREAATEAFNEFAKGENKGYFFVFYDGDASGLSIEGDGKKLCNALANMMYKHEGLRHVVSSALEALQMYELVSESDPSKLEKSMGEVKEMIKHLKELTDETDD